MLKALRVVLIVWAAIMILHGLGYIFAPEQFGAMSGLDPGSAYVLHFLAVSGVTYIVVGAFLIVAATRDILRNILWVQLAIAWAILTVAVNAYSIMRGFVTFDERGVGIILAAVFAAAFLALYPWRAARISD